MTRIVSSGNVITYVMIIFLTLHTKTRAEARFNFSKLTFQWPESFCNAQTRRFCNTPLPYGFTIRSFMPMYLPDIIVPPYANNQSCSSSNPEDSAFITEASLVEAGINDGMVKYWPDLLDRNGIRFWQSEWEKHGRCFDYHDDDRLYYFKLAVNLAPRMDLLKILEKAQTSIVPSTTTGRKLSAIAEAISKRFRVQVEIHCNFNGNRLYQLSKVTICIRNNFTYMDCPQDYHHCPFNRDRMIQFPFPSQVRI